jgi:hypothetical protein
MVLAFRGFRIFRDEITPPCSFIQDCRTFQIYRILGSGSRGSFCPFCKILIILYDIESLSGWLEGQKLSYTATTPTDCGARCYGTRLDLDATGGGSVPFLGGSLGI